MIEKITELLTSEQWILSLFIFSLLIKAVALWYAGKGRQKIWFIVFVFINSAGLLELIYLLLFRREK